jgi:hypothetical protein
MVKDAACPLGWKIDYRNTKNPGQWGIVRVKSQSSVLVSGPRPSRNRGDSFRPGQIFHSMCLLWTCRQHIPCRLLRTVPVRVFSSFQSINTHFSATRAQVHRKMSVRNSRSRPFRDPRTSVRLQIPALFWNQNVQLL